MCVFVANSQTQRIIVIRFLTHVRINVQKKEEKTVLILVQWTATQDHVQNAKLKEFKLNAIVVNFKNR